MTFAFGLAPFGAAVVKADAHRAGFHVARADHEHGVDARFLGVGDLGLDGRGAEVGRRATNPHQAM